MNLKNFPELETERLILRRLLESDWKSISYLRSDVIVNEFVKRAKADSKEKALNFIKEINEKFEKNLILYWSISLKNDQKMIGSICLWNFSEDKKTAEMGYDLNPEFQNKGIMNESMLKVLDYGFHQLTLKKIEAFTHKQNKNSISLLIKNNFELNKTRSDKNNLENIIFEIIPPAASSR